MVARFYNKHKFMIICFILILLKLFLICFLKVRILEYMSIDDDLMFKLGLSIKSGDYLGKYNYLTLTKGIFFPLFIVFLSLLNIPYYIGLNIFYILGICILTYFVKPLIKNDFCLLLLFIILLFHPVTFSAHTMLRFYRNSLESIFMIFFVSSMIGLYFSKKVSIIKTLFLGIIITSYSLNREDWFWILIPFVFFYILYFLKYKSFKPLFIILICLFVSFNTIKTLNFIYYDSFILNEISDTSYKDFLLDIMAIKVDNESDNWLNEERMTLIYKYSPTLNNMLNKVLDTGFDIGNKYEVENTYFTWYFKILLERSYICNDAKCADNFWKKASNELKDAYQKGYIEKRFIFNTPFIFPININEISEFFKEFKTSLLLINKLENLEEIKLDSTGSPSYIEEFENFVNMESKYYKSYIFKIGNYRYTYYNYIQNLNYIYKFYRFITPILTIIAIFKLILSVIYKKIEKQNLIASGIILFSTFFYLAILSYVQVTNYTVLVPHYLQGVYILYIIGILIFILGGDFKLEKYLFNNFISLFKRRIDNRKVYKRS